MKRQGRRRPAPGKPRPLHSALTLDEQRELLEYEVNLEARHAAIQSELNDLHSMVKHLQFENRRLKAALSVAPPHLRVMLTPLPPIPVVVPPLPAKPVPVGFDASLGHVYKDFTRFHKKAKPFKR